MRVSIIVNTFNRMHTLPKTLNSLLYLRHPDIETVVVNGPSTDGTDDYLARYWAGKIKLIQCEAPNLSKSRNLGLNAASGEIVCFIDDDGIPEANWIDQLIPYYSDKNVAAVGGWVRDHTGVEFQTKYIISGRDTVSSVLVSDPSEVPVCQQGAERFPGLIGVNSSFRRSHLIGVGGFDESYAYFLEETDAIVRLIDDGYKVIVTPDAVVHHKYAPSHIRAETGILKSLTQIANSSSYFIMRNSLPDLSVQERLTKIHKIKENWLGHIYWMTEQKLIEPKESQRLLCEFEQGINTGICTSFEFPLGQLNTANEVTPWNAFPKTCDPSERLKLAFVTALYPPRPCGGVAVFIHGLAVELAKLGHEITVITHADHNNLHTVDFEDGVWVHRLPITTSVTQILSNPMPEMPLGQQQDAIKVLSELDRINDYRKFDCVVGAIWDLDIAAVIASGKYRTAMYLVTSYKLMEESKKEWTSNLDFYNNHFLKMVDAEIWALKEVDHIIASTNAILADSQRVYENVIDPKKVSIIPFGLSIKENVCCREDSSPICVLFVGRLEYRKGIDILLNVAPYILEENSNVVFKIIGDNSLSSADGKNFMEEFLDLHKHEQWIDRVLFLGHVDDETLNSEYSRCDIFVAPSRYESFGLIYLEAMRYGKPCIGTTAGGIPEVVLNEITGLTVEPANSEALREAINSLIKDQNLRISLGQNGRKRFENFFTIQKFAASFLQTARAWADGSRVRMH